MIYTFYSYKGGVGRTMALANVAELFYQAGLKVLMVDWDLEAPGLERFFLVNIEGILDKPGVMDMLLGYKKQMTQELLISDGEEKSLPFEKPDQFIVDMYPGVSGNGRLWLLPAGRRSKAHFTEYANAVLTFDWQDFYQKLEGELYFEWLRQQFERIADVVLIDSRTGVTEMGGVCTYQLADVVVMFCSANQQSLEGTHTMLLDFKRPQVQEFRGRPLEVVIIPARIENAESDFLNKFQQDFLNLFAKHTPLALGANSNQFWQMKIPYVPRYAYIETVAVREKAQASAQDMLGAFSRLAVTISRLAAQDSPIRAALPETTIQLGDEMVTGVVIGDDIVIVGDNTFVKQTFGSRSVAESYPNFDPRLMVEVPGGVVDLESPFYVGRRADEILKRELSKFGTTVTIYAARQTGKSSLLVRGLEYARQQGSPVVYLDFQAIDRTYFGTLDIFLHHVALHIATVLEVKREKVETVWRTSLGPQNCLTRFLEDYVLQDAAYPIILAIDEADRLFESGFRGEFFSLIRTWFTRRGFNPLWKKLNVVIVISTQPYLLIENINQSPFNVGVRIELEDFTEEQVRDLNQRHGAPLDEAELLQMMYLLGGHPYLVHQALYTLVSEDLTWEKLANVAVTEAGPFSSHLRQYLWLLRDQPRYVEVIRNILTYQTSSDEVGLIRLISAGLIRQDDNGQYRCRCQLYELYFKKRLLMEEWEVEEFFRTGGALDVDVPSYVTRQADEALKWSVRSSKYCNVLTSRQMGKSSLMVRTVIHLQARGMRTVVIDLTMMGTEVSVSEWYFGLVSQFKRQLGLKVDEVAWWTERPQQGVVQRFTNFLRDVVLEEVREPIVVFVDEIDTTLNLPFADDFFAAIRAVYNARVTEPAYKRLTFVLLGVARPADLIKDRTHTPYNIGLSIDLRDFTRSEARALLPGLEAVFAEQAEIILERVLYWTDGHPYLTQKICAEVVTEDGHWTDELIDGLVKRLFLAETEQARKETNLQFIRDRIKWSPNREKLLRTYQQVLVGKSVVDDERDPVKNYLKLTGLLKATPRGTLVVRNRIYENVFNMQWIRANMPMWTATRVIIAIIVAALIVLAVSTILLYR